MSKEEEYDLFVEEHKAGFHSKAISGCETCFREGRIIRAWNTVNREEEDVIPRSLRNPFGDNYPLGYSPE